MAFKVNREYKGKGNEFIVSSIVRTEDGDIFRRSRSVSIKDIEKDLEALYIARTEYLHSDDEVTALSNVSDDLIYDSCIDEVTKKVEYFVTQWLVDLYIAFVDDKGVLHEVDLIKGDDGVVKYELKNVDKSGKHYDKVKFYLTAPIKGATRGIFTASTYNVVELSELRKLVTLLLTDSFRPPEIEVEYYKNGKPKPVTKKKLKEHEELEKSYKESFDEDFEKLVSYAKSIGVSIPEHRKELLYDITVEVAIYVDKEGFECVCDA